MSEVPTPWLCLQHDLRLAGIDPAGIRRVTGRTMVENVAALKAGTVDVIQVFEPFPSLLLAEGAAHVWYEAARRGPTSYTCFYARRGTLASRRDELLRLVRAIDRTEKWVAKASGPEIAGAIAGYFADVPPAILAAACTRYKALGIWGTTPILPRAGYDRLRDGLVSGGFVSPGATFETAVDNTLAEDVIARRAAQRSRNRERRSSRACTRKSGMSAFRGKADMQRRAGKIGCVALGKLPHSHSD